jgi:hypothetical protein
MCVGERLKETSQIRWHLNLYISNNSLYITESTWCSWQRGQPGHKDGVRKSMEGNLNCLPETPIHIRRKNKKERKKNYTSLLPGTVSQNMLHKKKKKFSA